MNNNNKKTIMHFTIVSFVVVSILVLWTIVSSVHAIFSKISITGVTWKFDLLMDMPFRLGTLAILILVALIIWSFYKQARPFTSTNVKRLKSIAIIMIILEPIQYLLNLLLNYFRPITEDGTKVTYVISYGGVWFAIGLAILCMSQIFKYGICLQNESDETL